MRLSDPNVPVELEYAKRLGALEMVARLYLLTNHPEDRNALVREVNLNFPGWPPIPEE